MKRAEYYEEIQNQCAEAMRIIEDDGKTLKEWGRALDSVQSHLEKIHSYASDLRQGQEDASSGQITVTR